jgi:hypothetical protein
MGMCSSGGGFARVADRFARPRQHAKRRDADRLPRAKRVNDRARDDVGIVGRVALELGQRGEDLALLLQELGAAGGSR